jgi:hypothetical protein
VRNTTQSDSVIFHSQDLCISQQCKQHVYNITMSRVRSTIVVVKKTIFWVFVCSLIYPACNAHLPYRHLWPLGISGFTIFVYIFLYTARFVKNKIYWIQNIYFDVLYSFFSETFILRVIERDMIRYVYWSSPCKVPATNVIF